LDPITASDSYAFPIPMIFLSYELKEHSDWNNRGDCQETAVKLKRIGGSVQLEIPVGPDLSEQHAWGVAGFYLVDWISQNHNPNSDTTRYQLNETNET
jgi:hypothetical protein